jgi:protein arginine kinase
MNLPPWQKGDESDIVFWVSSEFRRNLSGFPFGTRLTGTGLKDIAERIQDAFKEQDDIFPVESIPPRGRKILRDAALLDGFQPGDRRLFCMDNASWRWCTALGTEHLSICSRAAGLSVETSLASALAWEESLEQQLDFAFSLDLGYLLSDIGASGNALFHQALVFLPALGWSENREAIFRSLMKEGYSVHGIITGNDEEGGELFEVGTELSLGMGEEESANKFAHMLRLLVHYERKARENLDENLEFSLKDRVYRSYGLLASAERLSYLESKDALLALILGISLGLYDSMPEKLYELFWLTGDANLRNNGSEHPELTRAGFIRESLGIDRIIGGKDV